MNILQLNPPAVVTSNTLKWKVPETPQLRRRFQEQLLNEVESWIKDLSNKYNIQLSVTRNKYNIKVRFNGELVFRFSIFVGYNGIFKKVQYRKLTKLVTNRLLAESI